MNEKQLKDFLKIDLRIGYLEDDFEDKMDFFNHLPNYLKHKVLDNLEGEMTNSSNQRFELQDFIDTRQFIDKLKEKDNRYLNVVDKIKEKQTTLIKKLTYTDTRSLQQQAN